MKHRGTEDTERGGKKQREGIEGIGRGKRYRRGCPKPDWILGVWGKALVRNSVDFVPLCFKGFETQRHRGHGEVGKKQREGIEGIGRGKRHRRGVAQAGLDS
ncbi:MAG: hypothetical protein DWH99_10590 [Planctomycetota bacterium]|nr:MAG: hypothetical protein DWH99_10590 [Planctomycetota bacterium]